MFRGFKRNVLIGMGVFCLALFTTSTEPAYGFRDLLNKVGKTVDQATEAVESVTNPEAIVAPKVKNRSTAAAALAPKIGKVVFSKTPINPDNPTDLKTSFQAGDHIYGLIQVDKTWREFYNPKDDQVSINLDFEIDGKRTSGQYITLKKAEYIDSRQFVLDIAPAADKMTAYKNPDIAYGEGKGYRKVGPIAFTYDLSQLSPGKHSVEVSVFRPGQQKPIAGSFEIDGSDYKFYADLHEKVKNTSDAFVTLPKAGMIDKNLESQMKQLLQNAGWTNVLRVVIYDKGWWNDANRRRYLNVAAAARQKDGKCYWSHLQFSQNKLFSGGWGKLELTRIGDKRPITQANVYK